MINIDGAFGEGGGQILRTAFSLAAITGKPCQITRIRANRAPPGLRPQHLSACFAARKVSWGTLEGAEVGSQEILFFPGQIVGGEYAIEIGTAGSIVLVAQTILPILLFASKSSSVRISGGSHVMKSPGYDYFEQVFLPALRQFGISPSSELHRTGYYPRGGGEMELRATPSPVWKRQREWKKPGPIQAIIRLANLPSHIALREKQVLMEKGIRSIRVYEETAFSPGNAVTVFQGFRGSYVLGERGIRAERVAEEASRLFFQETGEVDCHLADQILLYAALAEGKTMYTTSQITEHLRTNAHVISHFLNRRITIERNSLSIE